MASTRSGRDPGRAAVASWTRRGLLAGLGALAAAPARGEAPRLRPVPDFTRLARDPFVVGVRPHRTGGVRLGLEEVSAARKFLVTNYGHGGAGITLAWGCADRVVAMVEAAAGRLGRTPSVAVVGAGVAGLTSASGLLARFPDLSLTVYAKVADPAATTSWVAGGQFEPSGIWREYQDDARKEELAALLRGSRGHIDALRREGTAVGHGIVERDDFAFDHEIGSVDRFTPADVTLRALPTFLPFPGLESVPGRRHRTFLVHPQVLLTRLWTELRTRVVPIVERTFTGRAELLALPQDVVVACPGLGARELLDDAAMVPQRGHLVRLEKADEGLDWLFSGGCLNRATSYVFCRQWDVVVGGTVVPGDDREGVRPDDGPVFDRVIRNAARLFAGASADCEE